MYIQKLYKDLKNKEVLKKFYAFCLGEDWVFDNDIENTTISLSLDEQWLYIVNYVDNNRSYVTAKLEVSDFEAIDMIEQEDIGPRYRAFMSRYPRYKERCTEHFCSVFDKIKNGINKNI